MTTWDTVFLVRHGQTQWNLQRRRQGRLDSPLTRDGLAQAHRYAALLRGRGIDGIFASPMGRAMTTAAVIGDALALEVQVVEELAELDHGEFSGLVDEEVDARFPGARERRAADKYRWRFPSGESYADADARASRALERVSSSPTTRPLLVSHEMIGRMLRRNLLGLEPHVALETAHHHGVVLRIDLVAAECRELR